MQLPRPAQPFGLAACSAPDFSFTYWRDGGDPVSGVRRAERTAAFRRTALASRSRSAACRSPRGATYEWMLVSGVLRNSLVPSWRTSIWPTFSQAISSTSLVRAASCGCPNDASQRRPFQAARRVSVIRRETVTRDRVREASHPPASVAGASLGTMDDASATTLAATE